MNFCKMCGEPLGSARGGTPIGGTPAVTPVKINPRHGLPSALAAVVGSGPTPHAIKRVNPAGPPTLKKPMLAATVPDSQLPPQKLQSQRPCKTCGAQTPVGFAYCQQCGQKLDPTESAAVAKTMPPPAEESKEITIEGLESGATMTAVADTLAGEAGEVIVPLIKKRSTGAAPQKGYGRLITVQRDGSDGASHPLVDDVTDLGRADGTLTFDDRFLAPRHARIERRTAKDGAIVVTPLDTTNGVYFRLRAGESSPLVDGDFLLVGKEVLRFEVVEPEERALSVAIQHGIRLFGSPIRSPWGRLRQIVQTGATRDIYHLVPAQVILGREEGDLRFSDDEFMSRRHARISNRDGRYEVADLESSNGTFVRVRGERAIKPGDLIRMGDQLLRFETNGI